MSDEPIWLLPGLGLLCGMALGATARFYRFCTLSALERHWYAADSKGLRSWVLSAAVALVSTQLLIHLSVLQLEDSFYLLPRLNIVGAIIGGVLFGFGMALVGTCGFGALVRLGGGSLQSLVVVACIGITALSTQRGVLGIARESTIEPLALTFPDAESMTLPTLFSHWLGSDLSLWITAGLILLLFIWIFISAEFRRYRPGITSGVVIGLCVTFGWFVTSTMSQAYFAPVQIESASFVLPPGQLIQSLISTVNPTLDYGVGLVVGVAFGAFFVALLQNDIRWEACDDARELKRHLAGGLMMGLGGTLAGGCTIGQGVSAMSVMAISAPIVFISMCVGAKLGLIWLLEGFSLLRR